MANNIPWLPSNHSHIPYTLSESMVNTRKLFQFREEHLRNVLYGKFCDVLGEQKKQFTSGPHMYQCRGYRFIVRDDDCGRRQRFAILEPSMSFVNGANESERLVYVPDGLTVKQSSLPNVQLGIFSDKWISEGTEMGPYNGRIVRLEESNVLMRNEFMWEVLNQNGELSHFIDGNNGARTNWMCFVNCARSLSEQNLTVHQHNDGNLYYKAMKDIAPDQELLVWYGPEYVQFLGIPDTQQFGNCIHNVQKSNSQTVGRMKCTICYRGFNSRSNLRSHMRIHTAEKPFQCKYCRKSFSQSSTLRNHIRLHTGEKPYKCRVCNCAYSQLAGLRAHQKSARHRPPLSTTTIQQPNGQVTSGDDSDCNGYLGSQSDERTEDELEEIDVTTASRDTVQLTRANNNINVQKADD